MRLWSALGTRHSALGTSHAVAPLLPGGYDRGTAPTKRLGTRPDQKGIDMADHPMAAKYREGTKAMDEGRPEEAADMVADDVTWWMIGAAEPLKGKQALMESMGAMSDVDLKIDMHDVIANDEHLIALVTATATRNGKTLVYKTAEIHHHKDGKITERWAFSDDTDAINKFFA